MDKFRRKFVFQLESLLHILVLLCCMVSLAKSAAEVSSSSSDGFNPSSQRNYTYPSESSSSQGFVPSATIEDPVVFASRSHSPAHPRHHPHPHHPTHHELPPGVAAAGAGIGDKAAKGLLGDGKALTIEKSPPELQFGLSFTVPFLSMSTERLLNTLTGKSFSDPYNDVASLLKLNVGGLILAAVVGLAALFFVPSLLPGKLPGLFSQGFPHGFMPTFLDQLVPGLGLNKPFGYGQYEHAYDPYAGDYSGSGTYNRNEENFDGRGRALKRGAGNSTVYTELFSTVQKAVKNYWGEMEACASHAICLKGKELYEEKQRKVQEKYKSRRSRRPDDPADSLDEESISAFEHVIEAISEMKGITRNMPLFHDLHKAYKAGQTGADCVKEFKKCPITPDQISKTINSMGNYIFNN